MQGSHFFDAPGSVGFTVDLVLVLLTACTIFPSYTTHTMMCLSNKPKLYRVSTQNGPVCIEYHELHTFQGLQCLAKNPTSVRQCEGTLTSKKQRPKKLQKVKF